MQPLLYDYNEYGERVGMRTFQTTPEGDPSHVEETGAKTVWHFREATGSLLRKEYADGKGPEYSFASRDTPGRARGTVSGMQCPSSARAEIGDERGVRSMEGNPFLRGRWCVGTERLGEWAVTF